ncbi:N-acetylmuramoyl-L-alanine amidase [Orrella sp. JC864]
MARWQRTWQLRAGCLGLAGLLAGCAGTGPQGLDIDTSVQALGQSSRVRFLVLHYTGSGNAQSLKVLSRGQVSSHYLITDEPRPRVYRLVDEHRSAWHAGQSQWHGRTWLNASSIGIEIVNPGWTTGADGKPQWHPYSDAQIETLIALMRDIVQRHGIAARDIVAHSDIAPRRKWDPGPLFPWKRLAQAGLGRWYDEAAAARLQAEYEAGTVPDVAWFQSQLHRLGYAVPQHGVADEQTVKALVAFQLRYRPSDYEGRFDAQSAAILQSLPD